jgi:hypothetical protein
VAAVERARYAFVIGATKPSDVAYPPAVSRARGARASRGARLERVFGFTPRRRSCPGVSTGIETTTRAPEQWQAIKAALGNDRRRVEDAFCRPLLVHRFLQARFAPDPRIHAETYACAARPVRCCSRAGRRPAPPGWSLGRRGTPDGATDDLLMRTRAEAVVLWVLRPLDERPQSAPVALHPEAAAALEAQLLRPGDVSTVLSEWDRFTVYRLIESTDEAWTVEAGVFPKRDFESWFRETTGARREQ